MPKNGRTSSSTMFLFSSTNYLCLVRQLNISPYKYTVHMYTHTLIVYLSEKIVTHKMAKTNRKRDKDKERVRSQARRDNMTGNERIR